MTNFEQLDAAIDYAVQHPDQFDMSDWFQRDSRSSCGTTACLAGTVAHINGWRPEPLVGDEETSEWAFARKDDRVRPVEVIGAELLDISGEQLNIFYRSSIRGVIYSRNEWALKAGIPVKTWMVPAEMLLDSRPGYVEIGVRTSGIGDEEGD